MTKRVVFHIDANSAFLSWTAAHKVLILGGEGGLAGAFPRRWLGNRTSRHSIILAKSGPAKKYGIHTGEPLFQALEKCPNLTVVEPDYGLYVECSRHMVALLRQVAPAVEQYSIDEAWADMTGTEGLYGPPVQAAEMLRERIHRELGFTVNIGVSSNKLLAKIAGDFQKPKPGPQSLSRGDSREAVAAPSARSVFGWTSYGTEVAPHGDWHHWGAGPCAGRSAPPGAGKAGGDHLAFCQRPQCRPSAPGPNRKQGLWQLRDLAQRRDRPAYGPSGAPESV